MKVTLETKDGFVKNVHIDCKPTEYFVLITALEHMSNLNPIDIKSAEAMAEDMRKVTQKAWLDSKVNEVTNDKDRRSI